MAGGGIAGNIQRKLIGGTGIYGISGKSRGVPCDIERIGRSAFVKTDIVAKGKDYLSK
jgi:hypothetical protein